MNHAVFILSTGRCGTQWIAAQLSRHYSDRYHVEHEPLHNNYCPRKMLSCRDPRELGAELAAPLLEHATSIERTLTDHNYIECGHPCWSTLPYFAERFRGRIRIVHLTRHPVPTAFSWLTHGAYVPPLLPHLPQKDLLVPSDKGVSFPDYVERWAAMTPFEKCLYYWAEINAFGLSREKLFSVPWLRISYENIFGANALDQLLAFLDLPEKEEISIAKRSRIDEFAHLSAIVPDTSSISNHPCICDLAQQLGYDPLRPDVTSSEMNRRYLGFEPR